MNRPKDMGRLECTGYRFLGKATYEYWECVDCQTTYPVIDGVISCNGRAITKCLCSGDMSDFGVSYAIEASSKFDTSVKAEE